MSDSEIDDLQHFETARQNELRRKAGLTGSSFQPEEMSDEEVMGLRSDDSGDDSGGDDDYGQEAYYEQDDDTVAQKRDRTNRELDGNWGPTRDNYFGGEDDIGADEGASEEEEEEAVRLHQQELDEMGDDDFVDEDDLAGWKSRGEASEDEADRDESSARAVDPSAMNSDERREFLQEKFPAVLLLSHELTKFPAWERELETADKPEELVEAGKAALTTYKGVIYSFFALFSDRLQQGDLKGLSQLEEHPVNEALLVSRQLWQNFLSAENEKPIEKPTVPEDVSGASASEESVAGVSDDSEAGEVSNDDDGMGVGMSDDGSSDSASDDASDDVSDDASDDEFSIAKPPKAAPAKRAVGDFDETADTIEEQARAKNKQSLRFYTSQIGKNDRKFSSYSGDDDLPYKERDFERRERLLAEAKKRGEQQRDRLDEDDDEDINDFSQGPAPMDDEALDLYSQAQREHANRKHVKQQRHQDAVEASRQGRLAEYLAENPHADKRAINYQIEKNKGLTKKRKKENRNARVKKRVRYDAAQKRLKGVRKVYTGQQGPYQGELSGIRKNLSHSSKFKS